MQWNLVLSNKSKLKSGARLVGSFAHVASFLWYIGIQMQKDMSLNTQLLPESELDCNESSSESSSKNITDSSWHKYLWKAMDVPSGFS